MSTIGAPGSLPVDGTATPQVVAAPAPPTPGPRVDLATRIPRRARIGTLVRGLPLISIAVALILVVGGLLAPWLSPHDPYLPNLRARLQAPSAEFLLGTDSLGRDILTRLLYGARTTVIVVVLTLVVGGGVGLLLGMISGYSRGWVGTVISRLIDATLAFPTIFFGLLFAVTMGAGMTSLVVAISLVLWAQFARVIRGEVLALRERDFIAQAVVNGCSSRRILLVDVLPNVMNSFMVLLSLNLGYVIIAEASLSYLGAGIPPPTPSWGRIIADGQEYIGDAWWIATMPGLAITGTVVALNSLGDWVRDHFDPKMRR